MTMACGQWEIPISIINNEESNNGYGQWTIILMWK